MMRYIFNIGGINISVLHITKTLLQPTLSSAFMTENVPVDIALEVMIVDRIDACESDNYDIRNSAWGLKVMSDGFHFHFFDKHRSTALMFVNKEYSMFRLRIINDEMHDILPPLYVMHIILSGYMTLNRIGFIFHGALVEMNGFGIVLTGESGAGKSTLSDLLSQKGYRKVGDDRIILAFNKGGSEAVCYSTPFDYKRSEGVASCLKVMAIVKLAHADDAENRIFELDMHNSMIRLIISNLLPLYSSDLLVSHFSLCETILRSIPLFYFAFLPDISAVNKLEDFLAEYEFMERYH